MAQSSSPEKPQERTTPAQANPKVVVSALAVIGLAALVLGTFQLLGTIREPFTITQRTTEASDAARLAEEERLQGADTDTDGLSDYDELTLYATSPFLADSDSDGADDKAEVLASTDPNCPQGQDCGPLLGAANVNAGNVNATSGPNLGAETLRQTLKGAGAPAYPLDTTDDASLLKLYEDVAGTTNTNADRANVLQSLRGLSGADARKLLQGAGADATLLEQVDDASLKAILDRALNEEPASPSP